MRVAQGVNALQGWVAEVQAGTVQLRQIAGKRQQGGGGGAAGSGGGGGGGAPPKVPLRPGGTRAERRAAALAVLGFGPTETPDLSTLKAAYRQCALKWHPDRKQNHDRVEEATENFQKAKEAFDALARAASLSAGAT